MRQITFEQLPEAFTHLFNKVENIERLLIEKSESAFEEDKILTIREASQVLTLSVPTIYGLVSRSQIPVSKKGKRLYFSKKDLTEWIKAGRKKTSDEIASEAKLFTNRNRNR